MYVRLCVRSCVNLFVRPCVVLFVCLCMCWLVGRFVISFAMWFVRFWCGCMLGTNWKIGFIIDGGLGLLLQGLYKVSTREEGPGIYSCSILH